MGKAVVILPFRYCGRWFPDERMYYMRRMGQEDIQILSSLRSEDGKARGES